MKDPVDAALALWGLQGARATFIAGRENRVYRVASAGHDLALRFKRPGCRSDAELSSELHWMAAIDAAGLSVPRPILSTAGALLERIGEQRVNMLSWYAGHSMAEMPPSQDTFHTLGQEIARLHDACDAWVPPPEFNRCNWDADGLLGDDPVWGQFWDNPTLDAETRALLIDFRAAAKADLTRQADLDYGLIHADLVGENVLLKDSTVTFIDFDDGGFGYRLFDLATVVLKLGHTPQIHDLTSALLDGYRSHRAIDVGALDLFVALRAVTYVGWIIPRIAEEGGLARAQSFTSTARTMCQGVGLIWTADTAWNRCLCALAKRALRTAIKGRPLEIDVTLVAGRRPDRSAGSRPKRVLETWP